VSRAPRTLRFRLTAAVVGLLALALGGFSAVVYAAVSGAMWRAFDARLQTEVSALIDMIEEHSHGRFKFEREGISAIPEFTAGSPRPAYFAVWRPDGTVLAVSRSLGERSLERLPGPAGVGRHTARRALPDGRNGLYLQVATFARWASGSVKVPPPDRQPITILLARDTVDEDAALARLRLLLAVFGGLALAVAAAAGTITISRGLRPVAELATAIERMDAGHLGERIDVPDLPPELAPPVGKLNELLARLAESFAREHRFTADVSHELRTPLAGLRSLLEVAASRERSPAEYRATVEDAIGIVRQMHTMVENLLMLARLDANQIEVARAPIALRAFAEDCWRPFATRAAARGLAFANEVPDDAVAYSDKDKLRLVLSNLLANAVQYTQAGGWIAVRGGDGALFDIVDSGPAIPEAALPRLFERFYRADSARSGGGVHCGIGLALVRAVCAPLGFEATAANLPDGSVRFRVAAAAARAGTPPPAPAPPASGTPPPDRVAVGAPLRVGSSR
jgi:heavy metal sensor kinase